MNGRRRKHEDHLAHLALQVAHWKHRVEVAEAKVVNLRVNCGRYQSERDEAIGRLRELAAKITNRASA